MKTMRLNQQNSRVSRHNSITKNGPVTCQLGNQRNQIDDDEHGLMNGLIILVACPITKRVPSPLPCIITDQTWLFREKIESVSHHHQFLIKKWDWWVL
jgi:hypothetical protein